MKYTIVFVFTLFALSGAAPPPPAGGDDGQYHPSDEGKYVPDPSGGYGSDGTGQYQANGAGQYRARPQPQVQPQQRLAAGPSVATFRYPQASYGQAAQPSYAPVVNEGPESRAQTLRSESEVNIDGYRYLYETDNGIFAEEEGHLQNQGSEAEAVKAVGDFRYTGPDGTVYSVSYVADENGFQPVGAHLPTPPPVPEAIARSLEFNQQEVPQQPGRP